MQNVLRQIHMHEADYQNCSIFVVLTSQLVIASII
jgi:hypothetical protein